MTQQSTNTPTDLPRIMELCLSPSKGGLELYMVRAAHFLGTRAISVISQDGQLGSYFTQPEHTCFCITRHKGLAMYMTIRTIARLIDQHAVGIVHVHFAKDLPLAALACAWAHARPRLIHTRSMILPSSKNDFYHRWLYRQLDCFIAISKQVARQAKKHIPVLSHDKIK